MNEFMSDTLKTGYIFDSSFWSVNDFSDAYTNAGEEPYFVSGHGSAYLFIPEGDLQ